MAKDNLERTGTVPALAAGFVQIELDLETGKFEILDYLGVADCGTVLHPQSLANQVKGGAVMGFGMACLERRRAVVRNIRRTGRSLLQPNAGRY